MKHLRILALVLAMIMCLSVGFAEEAADDNTDLFNVGSGFDSEEIEEEIEEATTGTEDDGDDDSDLYDTIILSQLDVSVEEWLLSADLRAMLAVCMDFELYSNPDFDTDALADTYGDPTIYVVIPSGFEGLAVGVMYFYTEAELVISTTYVPILGQYNAFQSELSLNPETAIIALVNEEIFDEYYEVTSDDYYNAALLMYDALYAE